MGWQIEQRLGLYLPQIDLALDSRAPADRAFVSHAHFDHLGKHKLVICSRGTSSLMRARLPGEREEIVLDWDEPHRWESGAELRLFPAGHIFGSAQLWAQLADDGESLLYTGDFKLRPGKSAEVCATPSADVVIMETTYGLPRYRLPPTEEVLADIIHFCRQTIDDGEVPVLFGYSLGKSQELLSSLDGAGLPLMLHSQVHKITQVYESLGGTFPAYREFELGEVHGHVVLCPPQAGTSAWLRKIKPRRTAVVTGWALDSGAIFRYQCDAAFPLSDHADYTDLLRFVEAVGPQRVFTVHGYAREFARDLRARGIEAWAFGQDNQLEMALNVGFDSQAASAAADKAVSDKSVSHASLRESPPDESKPDDLSGRSATSQPTEFLHLAQTAERIRWTASKLEKIALLADTFRVMTPEQAGAAATYLTGRPFAQSTGRALQTGWAIVKAALLRLSGFSEAEYRASHPRGSDSGDVAEAVLLGRTTPEPWPVDAMAAWFDELAKRRGPVAKREWLEQRLVRLTPVEARYLVKIIVGDLRIGLKDGLVEEALAHANGVEHAAIREALMLTGDLERVARAAAEGTLGEVEMTVFSPVQFMLASPEPDAESIIQRLGETVWVEEKYDGIRCQAHKLGDRVELYSRDLRRLTNQFPDLVEAMRGLPFDFIGDAELLAWRDGRALPFADLQKRLGRKDPALAGDLFEGAETPVSLMLYDLLWLEGEGLLKRPLRERRAVLEGLDLAGSSRVELAPQFEITGAKEIDCAFERARERGNEGLMIKDPDSVYLPGRRGLSWLKLKKAYATIDAVVVRAEWGHGKRKGVLSDYTFAVRGKAGELLTIGKAYSGLTDDEIARLTEHFLQTTLEDHGRYRTVQPDTVLEIAFDSIQPSKRHESGLAMRFPRIARIRDDKSPADIDTLEHCQRLARG